MRTAIAVALALLVALSLARSVAYCEEISLDDVAVTGIDRSTVDLAPPGALVSFPLEKSLRADRGVNRAPFSLGPFSFWSRVSGGSESDYRVSLFSGLTTPSWYGDLQGDMLVRDWRHSEETALIATVELALARAIEGGFEVRTALGGSYAQFELMGPSDAPQAATRTDNAFSTELVAKLPLGSSTQFYAGVFYELTKIERATEVTERRSGVTVSLATERLNFRFIGWVYDIEGDGETLNGSLEVRSDRIYQDRNLTIGGVLGVSLLDSDQFQFSPKASLAWRLNPRVKLSLSAGMEHRLPTLADEVLLIPEYEPFTTQPQTVREIFGALRAEVALTRLSSVSLELDYRTVKNMTFFERGSNGYLWMNTVASCEVFGIRSEGDVRLTGDFRLFGRHYLTFASPGSGIDQIPYLPTSRTLLGAEYRITDRLTVSAEVEITGSVHTRSVDGQKLQSRTLVNAEVTYRIEDYLFAFVRGTNLANEWYEEYEGWQGFGRALILGLELTF